jgi:hypothetical protein
VCLYLYDKDGSLLYVCVYVDDAAIVDNDSALRDRFVSDLGKRFPIEDKGELEWLLGIAVRRDRVNQSLELSQELYVADIIGRFADFIDGGLTKNYDTPFPEGLVLSRGDSPEPDSEAWRQMATRRPVYMSIVGALCWLANMTFPQLAYATTQLSRFVTNPGPAHFNAALRVLVYASGARNHVLRFQPDVQRPFEVYVDSSWLTDYSCSGAMFFFYGCLFHWFSRTQRSVSLSSAEAEFFGAMLAAKDVVFLRDVLVDLGLLKPGPTVLWSDSKSAVDLAFDPVAFKNTKHILRAANFLRDLVAKRVLTMDHIQGVHMLADLLTKAPARARRPRCGVFRLDGSVEAAADPLP